MRLTRLRELRERAFLTQRELAAKSGIAQATVNRIELGRQEARIGTARKLARGLGVEPQALVDAAAEGTV
jgi:transcriptional regulator with XRE-family HTH domain